MSEIEWADMTSEIERLRERVAELEHERDECVEMRRIYDSLNHELRRAGQEGLARVVELTKERDAALAQVAVLREALEELLFELGDDSDGKVLRPTLAAMKFASAALASTPEPAARLSEEAVSEIRGATGVSQQEIARRFGVSQSTVSAIKLGKVRRYG